MASKKVSSLQLIKAHEADQPAPTWRRGVLGEASLTKAPEIPAVYLLKDSSGKVLYIGKADNLKKRLVSHFKSALDYKNRRLIELTKDVFYIPVDSPFKALLLEAELIKKHQPKFNVKLKDDKRYPYIEITEEKYPRVFMSRKKKKKSIYLGPFTNKKITQEVLKIARTVFPYRSCRVLPQKPCLYYHLKLCSAPCINKLPGYRKSIKNLIDFLRGRKVRLSKNLTKAMEKASKNLEFEKAALYKKQIEKIQQVNKITMSQLEFFSDAQPFILEEIGNLKRIECFDISVFAKQEAVGSMVVFKNGKSLKNDYRRFKIRGDTGDDLTMIREVISRRLKHKEWPLPQLFIVDGGRGQVRTAFQELQKSKIKIPLLGLIKEKEEIVKIVKTKRGLSFSRFQPPRNSPALKILQKIRDESHRFAISYHRLLRSKKLLAKKSKVH